MGQLPLPDEFDGWAWRQDDGSYIISFITAKNPGRGHFSKFIDQKMQEETCIKVPTVMSDRLLGALVRRGFMPEVEEDEKLGPVDLMVWRAT